MKNILRIGVVCIAIIGLVGGCPTPPPNGEDSVVDVSVSASVSSGESPLTVAFSATGTSSPNGGPYRYDWDFADGTSGDGVQETNTFVQPGLYTVRLTVTDGAGETGVSAVDVRVRGVGATAVLSATPESGPAPLLVRFDGTLSAAPDDVIRDYFWDFGDGTTSQQQKPVHSYTGSGNFTVTLRVVTAGGVEDTTTLSIRVDSNTAALLFENGDRATLPVANAPADPLEQLTIEAWYKSDSTGGTILAIGGAGLVVAIDPENNNLRLTLNGETTDLTVQNLAGNWRHLAVTYNAQQIGATVFLDGQSIGTADVPMTPEIEANAIVVG
ncbi:MAG: PKD domain-containing protein, partial [Phycisphaerae bacterium]